MPEHYPAADEYDYRTYQTAYEQALDLLHGERVFYAGNDRNGFLAQLAVNEAFHDVRTHLQPAGTEVPQPTFIRPVPLSLTAEEHNKLDHVLRGMHARARQNNFAPPAWLAG